MEMTAPRHVGVIDIGKTNVKVAVVDLESRSEIGVLKRPNRVLPGPPYPHYDIEGHWRFICDALGQLHRQHRIDALSVTTHGASTVLLDDAGNLATPMLDYEFDGPDSLAAEYDVIRPDFSETGSPRLAMGLNVGAQLFWLLKTCPDLPDRISTVLTYPQYWGYRLTGVLASEVTSFGCHTDLWAPWQGGFSSLVERLGLKDRMAPLKRAGDSLGTVLPEVAERTGLPEGLPVACGIHDSNASLYPHLLSRPAPFSVVSTGTWVIIMTIGGKNVALDPARDTLINVDAFGNPVSSAKFMGGREFDIISKGRNTTCSETEISNVLEKRIMLFPAVDPRSGPFQGRKHSWSVAESGLSDGERYAALSFYLALVTSECLIMTGAAGPIVVEGPFARNRLFLEMLAAATGRPVTTADGSLTGTSVGAALLVSRVHHHNEPAWHAPESCIHPDPKLKAYATAWLERVQAS